MKEILGIIPARGGSKGIPLKNLSKINGKTLVNYAISAGKKSKYISRLVLSTDNELIREEGERKSCEIIERPSNLGLDDTSTIDVVKQVLVFLKNKDNYVPDIIVLLQPTAPLRTSDNIDEVVELLIGNSFDSVVSVAEVPAHFNPDWQLKISPKNKLRTYYERPLSSLKSRRQDLEKTYYRNGAIYACYNSIFEKYNDMYGKSTLSYVMPEEKSINIDTENDLFLAQQYINL